MSPHLREEGPIDVGVDPVDIYFRVILSCLHNVNQLDLYQIFIAI